MATREAEGNLQIRVTGSIKNTLDDGKIVGSASIGGNIVNQKITNGVSANNWNRIWSSQERTITAGNTEDIDLYDFAGTDIGAGAGNDAIGLSMALEEIVAIVIIVEAGTGSLEVMPSQPTNYWTPMPVLTVALGNALTLKRGFAMWAYGEDGYDVTDASSHVIRLGAVTTNIDYSIYVFGRHDDDESSSSSSSSESSSNSSSSSSSSSTSSLSSSSSKSSSSQSSSSSSPSSQSTSSASSSSSSSSTT